MHSMAPVVATEAMGNANYREGTSNLEVIAGPNTSAPSNNGFVQEIDATQQIVVPGTENAPTPQKNQMFSRGCRCTAHDKVYFF